MCLSVMSVRHVRPSITFWRHSFKRKSFAASSLSTTLSSFATLEGLASGKYFWTKYDKAGQSVPLVKVGSRIKISTLLHKRYFFCSSNFDQQTFLNLFSSERFTCYFEKIKVRIKLGMAACLISSWLALKVLIYFLKWQKGTYLMPQVYGRMILITVIEIIHSKLFDS